MFPMGQPPYPPRGQFTGFQQGFAPQMMRSLAPFLNHGSHASRGGGANSFGFPGMGGANGFGFPGIGGAQMGSQAFGAVGNAAKTGGAGWLGHMQTALKAMQSAAPMFQQYGPMVKNIPAMINMMKLMNESDEEESQSGENTKESSSSPIESLDDSKESPSSRPQRRQGTSQPKLYL